MTSSDFQSVFLCNLVESSVITLTPILCYHYIFYLYCYFIYLIFWQSFWFKKKKKPKQTFFASQKHGVRIGAGHHHSWRLKPPHTCESNGTCFPRCSEHIPILAETPRLSLLQTTGCGCVESWLFISSTNSRFLDIAKVLQQQARIW